MAEEFITTKLNPDHHLLLEQPLIRLHYELSRKNFKSVQKQVEHDRNQVQSTLKATANAALSGSHDPSQVLVAVDSMINRLGALEQKMQAVQENEKRLQRKSRRRIKHLGELYNMHSLVDVKYEEWSRTRLDRLLVDYLVRHGFGNTAKKLVERKGLEDLTDVDVFEECYKIELNLKNETGLTEALSWCNEHKALMKKEKGNNALEFHLRLQQFIELVRMERLMEAKAHMRKHLAPQTDAYQREVFEATGLFAYRPKTRTEPYVSLYSAERWRFLSQLFVKTHHELFAIPEYPLLQVALWGGLVALKTPTCHSANHAHTTNGTPTMITVCPICSTELNKLAKGIPYAHHSKSFVENNPVILPNGRVYGRDRIQASSAKIGIGPGVIKDPVTGEVFVESQLRQIYFP